MTAAIAFAVVGTWLVLARRRWSSDVYVLRHLGASGPRLATLVGLLFLAAALWIVVESVGT